MREAGCSVSGVDFATGFRDVDGSRRPAAFVEYLDALASLEPVRAGKRRRDRLVAFPGARVLDVGCGTGDDARAMGRLVGAGGRVVGLDSSEALLGVARSRVTARDGPVRFVRADAHELPFADGSFDAVRAERVLQHVEDPAAVVAEMARVVGAGGRVLAVEPDWGLLALDLEPAAAVQRVAEVAAAAVRHGRIGRRLRRLLLDAGLAEVETEAEVLICTELPLVDRLVRALVARALPGDSDGVAALAADVERAAADGRFLAAVTMFTVTGRRRHGLARPAARD